MGVSKRRVSVEKQSRVGWLHPHTDEGVPQGPGLQGMEGKPIALVPRRFRETEVQRSPDRKRPMEVQQRVAKDSENPARFTPYSSNLPK